MPKPGSSAIEQRKQQLLRQLEHLRHQLVTKRRAHYKTQQSYEQQQRRTRTLVSELEAELSMLESPGEYEELPVAVVADELGLTLQQVRHLIRLGEIEAGGQAAHARIPRQELERLCALGVPELLRLSRQVVSEIFEEAIPALRRGDVVSVERAYLRLDKREGWRGSHAPALLVALELARGDLQNAFSTIRFINQCEDLLQRTAMVGLIGRLLREMNLESHGTQMFGEQLLKVVGVKSARGIEHSNSSSNQHDRGEEQLQQIATYLATAAQHGLLQSRFSRKYEWIRTGSGTGEQELFAFIRDAIYTALHAEVHGDKSAICRIYVEAVKSVVRRWSRPPRLLEDFSDDGLN